MGYDSRNIDFAIDEYVAHDETVEARIQVQNRWLDKIIFVFSSNSDTSCTQNNTYQS